MDSKEMWEETHKRIKNVIANVGALRVKLIEAAQKPEPAEEPQKSLHKGLSSTQITPGQDLVNVLETKWTHIFESRTAPGKPAKLTCAQIKKMMSEDSKEIGKVVQGLSVFLTLHA